MLKNRLLENAPVILKYLAVGIVACVVFVLYITKPNETDSNSKVVGVVTGAVRNVVPSPVSDNQSAAVIANARVLGDSGSANSEIQLAFLAANEAIRQGDSESATHILLQLIGLYPELPEPYANLASLQAAGGQLSEARATLLQGLQAHRGYAALFSSLQKIQGALAANAYRSALADQTEAITEVALPVLENIELSETPQQKLKAPN